jgi:hypothetical protein
MAERRFVLVELVLGAVLTQMAPAFLPAVFGAAVGAPHEAFRHCSTAVV